MMKNILLFAFTFLAGAVITLAIRAAAFKPHAGDRVPAAAETHPGTGANAPDPAPHAGHKTVNTLCTICGMDVDPDIPPALYQGQWIGFGCSACPPKFKADPDRYGPHAIHNIRAP